MWGGGPNDVRSRSAFSIQPTKVFKYCSVDLLHFQASSSPVKSSSSDFSML